MFKYISDNIDSMRKTNFLSSFLQSTNRINLRNDIQKLWIFQFLRALRKSSWFLMKLIIYLQIYLQTSKYCRLFSTIMPFMATFDYAIMAIYVTYEIHCKRSEFWSDKIVDEISQIFDSVRLCPMSIVNLWLILSLFKFHK